MTLPQSSLAVCLSLALAGVSVCAKVGDPEWKQYSDSQHRFIIQHPGTTQPEAGSDKDPGLLSRVQFKFEQSFHSGADASSLKFNFQISVWQNTNHLTAEAWAKRDAGPQATLDTRPIQIAGRNGLRVRTSNQAWIIVKIFVGDDDCLYELRYMDLAANKLLLPDDTRAQWTATFVRMQESFNILSRPAGPK